MAGDEELLVLARAREAAPDDVPIALRAARAYARAGDIARAEAVLIEVGDKAPGDLAATAQLDALTGGRARGAPWPSPRGDARRSGRARVQGPRRGVVAGRFPLALGRGLEGIAVPDTGRALAVTPEALVEVGPEGALRPVVELDRRSGLSEVVLLPGGRLVIFGRTLALAMVQGRRVPHRPGEARAWAAGASGLLYAAGAAAVVSFPVAVPAERRSLGMAAGEGDMGLAIAPGGDLVVLTEGDPKKARPALVERRDAAGGLLWALSLPARHTARGHTGPVVAPDGVSYVAFPGQSLYGVDAAGQVVLERPYAGEPAALAGEEGEVLVCRTPRHGLAALDRKTGRELWVAETGFHGLPKACAGGLVYVHREDDLVALDARDGKAVVRWETVGRRAWDFVFCGGERVWAFVRDAERCTLVVLE